MHWKSIARQAVRFTSARDASLHPVELVMGFARDGEDKAYPVSVLRFREMVKYELAGTRLELLPSRVATWATGWLPVPRLL